MLLKKTQSSAFLTLRGCNKKQLSLQFCVRMTPQLDLLRTSVEKRIDNISLPWQKKIKYLISWLLQNKLLSVKMMFEIQKIQKPWRQPRLLYFKHLFDTEVIILQQTRTRLLYFLNKSFLKFKKDLIDLWLTTQLCAFLQKPIYAYMVIKGTNSNEDHCFDK